MPQRKDYYRILGVSKDASKDEIKRAFRRLAKRYHPDLQKGKKKKKEAAERFKDISEAYEVLMDDEKRRAYDSPGGVEAGDLFGKDGFTWHDFTRVSDLEDIFGKDLFRRFFGEEFRGYRTPEPFGREIRRRRARDLTLDVRIGVEDIYRNRKIALRLRRKVRCEQCSGTGSRYGGSRCPTCNGSGQVRETYKGRRMERFIQIGVCPTCGGSGRHISDPCRRCGGEGRHDETSTLRVPIPRGVKDGLKIRIPGKGDEDERESGDLYITFRVRPDPAFRIEGANLITRSVIGFAEAALGTEVRVLLPNGKVVLVRIPPGTQSGTKMCVRGKGLPLEGNRRGDLLVEVQVRTPQDLSPEERDIFRRLAELEKKKEG